MATQRLGNIESYVAAANLETHQFKLVEITGTDQVNLVNSAADRPCGVLQNKPRQGEWASVAQGGISKVLSDGSGTAIAAGDPLKCDNVGRAIKAVTDKDFVIGWATEASSAANIIIGVDLDRSGFNLAV